MPGLDTTFAALADPTRRAILAGLRERPATIGEIARPFALSLVAVSKHVRVLERAGLLDREIRGREHLCRLNAEPLREAHRLTAEYLDWWESRLDALDAFLAGRPAGAGVEPPPDRRSRSRKRPLPRRKAGDRGP